MAAASQYSVPYFVSSLKESDTAVPLTRIPLLSQEFHLQKFIMTNPFVLPIDQIERAFVGAMPVCMEMRTKSGLAIDNLLVTPKGDLILVECNTNRPKF